MEKKGLRFVNYSMPKDMDERIRQAEIKWQKKNDLFWFIIFFISSILIFGILYYLISLNWEAIKQATPYYFGK